MCATALVLLKCNHFRLFTKEYLTQLHKFWCKTVILWQMVPNLSCVKLCAVFLEHPIQRVDTFKLLGVHISNDLKWGQHVNVILSKAASRLYFLKQLKRAGAGTGDLLCFYRAMHVVLARYCYRKSSVRPSVRPSVSLSVCNVAVR